MTITLKFCPAPPIATKHGNRDETRCTVPHAHGLKIASSRIRSFCGNAPGTVPGTRKWQNGISLVASESMAVTWSPAPPQVARPGTPAASGRLEAQREGVRGQGVAPKGRKLASAATSGLGRVSKRVLRVICVLALQSSSDSNAGGTVLRLRHHCNC